MADEQTLEQRAAVVVAQVYALVRACPAGRVTTYGWLAAAVGMPRGARMVGWVLNQVPAGSDVPAHRVLNSKGELSGSWAFGQRGRMRRLLEGEGITFSPEERVDVARYGWRPLEHLAAAEREDLLAAAANGGAAVSEPLLRLLRDDPASPLRTSG